MTARPTRRKRRALLGLLVAVALVVGAGVLTVVGVVTLLDSEAGVAVEVDERPVVALPSTPNALVAVADDEDRLTSVVVATLRPEGVGGSLVTFPVNADVNAGFGPEPEPLSAVFDPDAPEELRRAVESMLAIAVQRVAVVDAVALAELIAPVVPVDVDLPAVVTDSDRAGTGVIARAGSRQLRGRLAVAALTAVDEDLAAEEAHEIDVALWSGLGRAAGGTDAAGARGASAVAPDSVGDLFARLWRGPVAVRDIAVVGPAATGDGMDGMDGPDGTGAVVLDRSDGLLVFTQISPALVSKPNPSLSFRIEARFDEAQLGATDGFVESNSDLLRRVIGELLFFQTNPVSSDPVPAREGAPSVTRVEVADPRFLEDVEEFAPIAFGESEVVEASRVIQGVDVVVRLGTGYFELADRGVADRAGDVSFAEGADEDAGGAADGTASTVAGDG